MYRIGIYAIKTERSEFIACTRGVFSNFKSRSGELCITVQVEMQKPNIFVVQFALFRLILGVCYLHVARHTDGRGWCGEFGVKSRLTAVVRLGTLWEQTGLGPGKIRKLDKYKTINNYLLTRRERAEHVAGVFIIYDICYEIQRRIVVQTKRLVERTDEI